MTHSIALREKLFSRLVITPAPDMLDVVGRPLIGPCLIWTGALDRGYGVARTDDGRTRKVHLLVYEIEVGIPEHELDHLCRIEACASPAHMEDVPHLINVRRGNGGKHNLVKTHCKWGHPFDEANTSRGFTPRGTPRRTCRRCHYIANENASRRRQGITTLLPRTA